MCSVRLQALFVAILLGWFPDPAGAENNVKEGVSLYQASFQGGELQALTLEEIGSALKKALHLGTGNVVMQLGRPDGYNGDPAIHISLPQEFQSVREVLNRFGGAEILDELELKLNRAAEQALRSERRLLEVPGAGDLLDEHGAVERVTLFAAAWFREHGAAPAG